MTGRALDPTPNLPGLTIPDMRDPALLAFPPMMPVELAMRIDTPAAICRAYGYSREEFAALITLPVFIKAYQEALESLKVDGMSFRYKARLQAEEYLQTSFNMVQNPNTSDSVRADLIKNTVKWAGLEVKAADNGQNNSFNIQINL